MTVEDLDDLLAVRESPRLWFEGFGYWEDDENSRLPTRGPALVLQRRYFEHYRQCLEKGEPCRIVGLKYRRASSSTAANAILYHHSQNFTSRLGVIGADYSSSLNMMMMVKSFATHDKFPGWSGSAFAETTERVMWDEEKRIEKDIATKMTWTNGSWVELYTAKNPKKPRSAGLQGYVATEIGFWPKDGILSGDKTLMALRNTLPKQGFHVAIEESTAEGAAGIFYDTCRNARYPESGPDGQLAPWVEKWLADWPLTAAATGPEKRAQFVFIFAAWFEDERNFYRLTAEERKHIQDTIDADPAYAGERELMERYLEDGPNGQRLGSETPADVWEQLAWRRVIIKNTGGVEAFKQEYPSNPLEAFRATGSAVFDAEGITALDVGLRGVQTEWITLEMQPAAAWPVARLTRETECVFGLWEKPIEGAKYLVTVDTASGKEVDATRRQRDCHSVLVLRDAYKDARGRFFPVKLVARIKAPCRWEIAPLARQVALLSLFYGRCCIVVESNAEVGLITRLRDDHRANLYVSQAWNSTTQAFKPTLGWHTSEESRRLAVSTGQEFVREQRLELPCAHVLGEMKTFIFDEKGKAKASGTNHDDDVMALCIGLTCLPAATAYVVPRLARGGGDERAWKTTGRRR